MEMSGDLVRRDPGISGLGLLLEPAQLREAVHARLGRAPIDEIRLDYLRYKPGVNCLARYEARVGGQSLLVHAKGHGSDKGVKLKKALKRPVVDTLIGPGRVLLEDAGVVFSVFPNDAKLLALLSLAEDSSRECLFGQVFGEESAWRGSRVAQVLNYKPERRLTLRAQRRDGESALVKFHAHSGWANPGTVSGEPLLIGESRRHAVMAYRWQSGTSLRDLGNGHELTADHLAATAGALAAFHAGAADAFTAPDRMGRRQHTISLAEQVAFLLPGLGDRARRLGKNLVRWLEDSSVETRPIHGDFKDEQVIVAAGNATLIDCDRACLGNPLMDLGNFRAHLERRIVSRELAPVAAARHWRWLLSAYENLSGPLPRDDLYRYVALGLFRQLDHPFRDCEPEWGAKMAILLELAETFFNGGPAHA